MNSAVRLLDRGRPISMTAPGRYLFEHAQQILLRVEEVRAMTRRLGKQKVARLSVGFVASTLYDALAGGDPPFRITAPDGRDLTRRDDHGPSKSRH